MSKDWIIEPSHADCEAASARWNLPPIVAQILIKRGIESPAQAKAFLNPRLAELYPPQLLPGVTQAAQLISDAVRAGKKIVIYGDYDVDGITATAILWHALSIAGAKPSFYVPHRINEGYGLNTGAINALADEGADLIVSVDCGIGSVEVAETARRRGIKLVITDHHQPGPTLPQADVIVHPTAGGSPGTEPYPNPHICGAGVAFKLAWAIAQNVTGATLVSAEFRQFLIHALPLAAMGTIADVVPLMGENRILARCGLAGISQCPWPGLRALLDIAGLTDSQVSGTDVSFKLAPRINAAGRMGHARLAIELLTRADESRAREIAMYLDEHNRARQNLERRLTRQAHKMIERDGLDGDANRAIVLAAEDWHPGVIGIVASKIVDRYCKPTVLIALENGVGQGSARSIRHFPLHTALQKCGDHLISHGGHAKAAGLKIKTDSVDAFTKAFVEHANNSLSGSALLPKLHIDGQVDLKALDHRTVTTIQNLGPFGEGNRKPLLATDWIELAGEPRRVGKSGDHLQLLFRQNGSVIKGIAFRAAEQEDKLKLHRKCRVAFEPIINEFNGFRSAELQVTDFKYPGD